jgi:hypothetical protein
MIVLLSMLLGLVAAQFIKVTVDPALIDFLKRSWSSVDLKPNDIKEKFIGLVNEAKVQTAKVKTIKASKVSSQDQAKAKECAANGTPTA